MAVIIRNRLALALALAVAVIGSFALARAFTETAESEPRSPGNVTWLEQGTSAEASGIRLTLVEASFSSTSTLARVLVEPVDESFPEIERISVPADALTSSDLHGAGIDTISVDETIMLIRLPAAVQASRGHFEIGRLDLKYPSSTQVHRMRGGWHLQYDASEADLDDDSLFIVDANIAAGETLPADLAIHLTASAHEVLVTYEHGGSHRWYELDPPEITLSPGDHVRPTRVEHDEEGRKWTAIFVGLGKGAIEASTDPSIDIGPFGVASDEERYVELALESALSRAIANPDGAQEVTIEDTDVLAGEVGLVLAVRHGPKEEGSHKGDETLSITTEGAYHRPPGNPEDTGPHLFDANGIRIPIRFIGSGYRTAGDSSISVGITEMDFDLERHRRDDVDIDLRAVTLSLSGFAEVSETVTVALGHAARD